MYVPFIDLKQNYYSVREEIKAALDSVLESCGYILGPHVQAFEKVFAEMHGVKHCVALNSGTAGNHVALWSLGICPGDEVIMPANTFIATAWGATLLGAKPVLVDCEPNSYNLDPQKVKDAISNKTKAIVAVHLYGQSADLNPLRDIAKEHRLDLVEDAAQSHIAEYYGKCVGGLSRISSFSFYPGKNLGAYGEAGAVLTNDDHLAEKARMIRDHGSSKKYVHEVLGHNYRMEGFQGAVLGVKVKYLQKWTDLRRAAASRYLKKLQGIGDLILPTEMPYAKHVYHLFVIKTRFRNELQKYLTENEIHTGLHYPNPLHLQKCLGFLSHSKGDFPVSEELADQCLSLPMFPELSEEQIDFIVEKVAKFFQTRV